jgi:hypothetical protein
MGRVLVNYDVVNCRVETVEAGAVVKRYHRDFSASSNPLIRERGNDPLDASRIKAIANKY